MLKVLLVGVDAAFYYSGIKSADGLGTGRLYDCGDYIQMKKGVMIFLKKN